MIEIVITDDMLLHARAKSMEMGQLRNSITKGAGNIVGFLGELVANKVLNGEINHSYDYDIVMLNGTTIDVKTKATSATPLPTYQCSVAKLNTKQQCDYYAFVRVKNDLSVGWYLGVYPKKRFFEDAVLLQKGDTDGDNGYIVKSTCYNLPISSLWPTSSDLYTKEKY